MIINRIGGAGAGTHELNLYVTADANNGCWTGTEDLILTYLALGCITTTYKAFARWTGVTIPQGATILEAWITFNYTNSQGTPPACTLKFEDADNPSAVSSATNGNSKTLTTASISVTGPTSGTAWNTNSIVSIIQGIVNRAGWSPGNAMQMIIAGGGSGVNFSIAKAYSTGAGTAPMLHVVWE